MRSTTAAPSRSSPRSRRHRTYGCCSTCRPGGRQPTPSRRSLHRTSRSRRSAAPALQPGEAQQQNAPQTELAEQVQAIRGGPVLDDLAILDTADHDPPDPDPPAAVMALGHPARGDPLALAHLVLDADAQVAVTEDELVETERLPDPVVPAVLARVDVIVEVGAVDANGGGRIDARADPLKRMTRQVRRIASRHRSGPP